MSTPNQAVFVPKAGTVHITVNDNQGPVHDNGLLSQLGGEVETYGFDNSH